MSQLLDRPRSHPAAALGPGRRRMRRARQKTGAGRIGVVGPVLAVLLAALGWS